MTQIIPSRGGGGGVGLYKYMGSVDYYEDLPSSGMKVGDVYNVVNPFTKDGEDYPAGTNVAWTGTDWDALGGSIDLSDYQKKLVEGEGIDIDQDTNEISVDITVIATKQDLATKQDVISDLDSIRSGAALGATSVQPGDNVSDLVNDAGYLVSSDLKQSDWGQSDSSAIDYIKNKPTIGNATLTIQKNGTQVNTFTANATSNVTANISVPTKTSDITNDSGFIDKDVNNLTNYTLTTSLASVATSGSYNDLSNKPSIPTKTSDLTNDSGFIDKDVNDLTNYTLSSDLAAVATSGSYNDLSNKPTIGTANLTVQKNGTTVATFGANATSAVTANITVPTKVTDLSDAGDYAKSSSLATVATSGDYDDLIDKPTIPGVVNSVTSTSTTDALAAAQGKVLQDQIDDLKALGKFLSLWDCSTGLPISFPEATPYTYSTGDYYLVEEIGETRILPEGYTQLEYIKNNGTEWIDLGIKIGTSDIVTFDMSWDSLLAVPFFGSYNSGGSYSTNSFVGTYNSSGGTKCFYANSGNAISSNVSQNTRYLLKWNGINSLPTLNGATFGNSSSLPFSDFTPNVNAYFFTRNQGGNVGNIDNITLYRLTVEGKGDFIPAKRNSDNEIGLYDIINNVFITSSGSGSLIGGGEISTINYRPSGSSYTGTASTSVEPDEVEVGDLYIYDGSAWLLQINHGKTVSFANLAGSPSDNAALSTVLGDKQDVSNMVTSLTGADNSHYPTAKAVADALSGAGNGDMLKATYDPDNVEANAFDYNNFINTPNLAAVATSGSYSDLSNTPSLAAVATSGSYNDLSNKPTIPTVNNATLTIQKNGTTVKTFTANASSDVTANISVPTKTSDITNDSGYITKSVNDLTNYTLSSALATVATTGSYSDLSNKPTIPTDTSDLTNGAGFITGITSGDVTTALGYTPYNSTNPSGYVTSSIINDTAYASSWNSDTTHAPTKNAVYDKISAMDTTIAGKADSSSLATVATSGSYNDLSNKPTIPVVDSALSTTSTNALQNKVITAALNGKLDGFTIMFAGNWSGGVHPVRFVRVDYSTANSENGVFIKMSLVNSHGNGQAGRFLEDVILLVTYTGAVEGSIYRYFGTPTQYPGDYVNNSYGDIFWTIDTENKIVDFYVLMHQFSYTRMTPYFRLNRSTGGVITQASQGASNPEYSSGTKSRALIYDYSKIPSKTSQLTNDSGFITSSALSGYQTTSNLKTSLTDNSDTYYPSQKAVKTAVDAKQDTLVSGTNIKTVNSNSLLGSGNISVQETLVSGTNIKTINNTSLLGSGNIDIQTGGNYTAGTGIDISQSNVISADISSADGKEYKITKVKKLPTVIDASTIYFVSTPKPFGDTITISWTETSNPAEFNPVWSDGAAGAEAGDERFDNWFGYSGVKLSSAGTETATASQIDGVLDITQLGTLTSGDNVMIKFPVRGIKMSKSGDVVTLSMTKELNKSGYQYYAFNRNGTIKSQLYLGAYKGSRVSNVLKSWSGQTDATSPSYDGVGWIDLVNTTSGTPTAGARYSARQNNTSISTGINGWDEITWYARNYVNALYMMKYGNPNSQSVIGVGYFGKDSIQPTGATDSITDATGATDTSSTGRIKLFGLEDRWGNCYEWLDGAYYTSGTNLNVTSTNVLTNTSWSASPESFNTNITTKSSGYRLKKIPGTNEGMFISIDGGGKAGTDYCTYFYTGSDYYTNGLCAGGSYYDDEKDMGALCVKSHDVDRGHIFARFASRLMFL